MDIEGRKRDHLEVGINRDIEAKSKNWFNDVYLVHRALPDIDREDVDASSTLFGKDLSAPIIIEGMTGGIKEADEINAALAEAVEEVGLALGVGSQRIALVRPGVRASFRVVREKAPHAFLMANLGCPQISREFGIDEVDAAIEMINADAIAIHMNPLQEIIQENGEAYYRDVASKLRDIVVQAKVPIIAKETGAGVSREDAIELGKIGISGIDVGGAGGTSWPAVEFYRGRAARDERKRRLGRLFWDWGIPTTVSIVEVRGSFAGTVIASGGIRSGLDIARALALGADCAGLALPILRAAKKGTRKVVGLLESLIEELRVCMFLVGAKDVDELKKAPIVILGKTNEWLRIRGFDVDGYTRR